MKRAVIIALAAGLALASLSGIARGDGIPITTVTVHRTLRENRQVAMVDVGEDGNETISLFISIASLEPGSNVTVLVPLKTSPNSVGLARTNDSEFELSHNMGLLHDMYKRVDGALGNAWDSYAGASGVVATLAVVPLGMYIMTTGYMTGGGGSPYQYVYVDEGLSAAVFSFGNTSSINETFLELGVDVPDDAQEMIDEYGSYGAAVINVVTRPPIDEESYNSFELAYPGVLDSFRDFVASHPSIDVTIMGHGKASADDFLDGHHPYYIRNFNDEELNMLMSKVTDWESGYPVIFQQLILATYGLAPMEGFVLEANVPLNGGNAFFPLGTSPSWSGQGDVKVAFKIDAGKGLVFAKEGGMISWKGSRYYLFDYGPSSPGYDLEARVVKAGINEWIADSWNGFSLWMDANADAIGTSAALATMWTIWLSVSTLISRKGRVPKRDRRALTPMMATAATLATLLASLAGGLVICLIMLSLAKSGQTRSRRSDA